ncbi:uncharacterized protein MELLADRAFT_111644 [Melampsora larici-populina 98AG31]|uniref:Uncharacterized protein n=1 Tax=Melampsora larici-populina (strain 98AG31 / pathotype 3-4-7) TaxID=747676 RepID=F4S3V8_MELLP|nr:uncharacterized protein MELLADRAFT_111644 [Melampsora larici-populina 98AG31]EGG00673.1 hypothetical protein MELLADRAFT_111644 [Melampsora larici-populina 98AG31]
MSQQQSIANLLHGRSLRSRGPTPGPSTTIEQGKKKESNKMEEMQIVEGVDREDTVMKTEDQKISKVGETKELKGGKKTKKNIKKKIVKLGNNMEDQIGDEEVEEGGKQQKNEEEKMGIQPPQNEEEGVDVEMNIGFDGTNKSRDICEV